MEDIAFCFMNDSDGYYHMVRIAVDSFVYFGAVAWKFHVD